MSKNAGLIPLIAGGAGAAWLLSQKKPATSPRVTTSTAKPLVDSYDKLFSNRAQQPIINGASGGSTIGATIDLVEAGKAIWGAGSEVVNAISKLFHRDPKTYSTMADYSAAKRESAFQAQNQSDLEKYGTPEEYMNGNSKDYGNSNLDSAYEETLAL